MDRNISDYYFNRFLNLIRATYMNLEKDWEEVATEAGLTHAQQHALWILHFEDGLSLEELGRIALWNKSTTCTLIGRLEKKGYIRKEKCKDHPKVKKIFITEEGLTVLEKSVGSKKAFYFMGLFNNMEKEEIDHFLNTLEKICHFVGPTDLTDFDRFLRYSSDFFLNDKK